MKVAVYNQSAEKTGDIDLNDKIFDVALSVHLLAEAVRVQESNARKGLAHTKNRGEVSGGGRKPWRQKGTGRARAGSNRSPLWRHGGVTFGPRSDRNWTLKMNKKAKTKALFMALSDKARDGQIVIVDKVELAAPKTKEFVTLLGNFASKLENFGKKQMLVMPQQIKELSQSSSNLPNVNTVLASSLNVKDVLTADTLLILKDSLEVIEKTYLRESAKAPKTAAKPAAKKAASAKTPAKKEVVKAN